MTAQFAFEIAIWDDGGDDDDDQFGILWDSCVMDEGPQINPAVMERLKLRLLETN